MRLKKSIKRGIAAVTITGIMASSAMPAFAKDYHIDYGDIKVDRDQVSYTDEDGKKYDNEKNEDGDITITGKSDKNTVSIKDADVTFKDLEIDKSTSSSVEGDAAVSVSGDSSIELDGKNTITSGTKHAGIEKADDNGTLTIKDDNGVSGSLDANGGFGGAGIGGGSNEDGSNITIKGGTMTANGGFGGAGIGGGNGADGSDITITGGTIIANGGFGGAGIGGGSSSSSGGGNGSDITISGGNVTANGGTAGAGIGGGDGDEANGLNKESDSTGGGKGSNISISGKDTIVNAEGGAEAAGIGGGRSGDADTIEITDSTVISNGHDSNNGNSGAGIGGGGFGAGGGAGGGISNITIKDADVTAGADAGGAGIGSGNASGWISYPSSFPNWKAEHPNEGVASDITISGGRVKASGGDDSAGIGGGYLGSGSDITIKDNADVTANGGKWGAGIGGGRDGDGSDISISDSNVSASGGAAGAGIGGGRGGKGENVTISGSSTVSVKHGPGATLTSGTRYGAGAGIGNGGAKDSVNGEELTPDTSAIDHTAEHGYIDYFDADGSLLKRIPHHIVEDPAVEPTCTSVGYTAGSHCDLCGEVFVAQTELPLKDHTPAEGRVNVREATTQEEGYTGDIVCAVCGTVLEYGQPIPKLPAPDENSPIDPVVPAESSGTVQAPPQLEVQNLLRQDLIHDETVVQQSYDESSQTLTIRAELSIATLTGTLGSLKALQAQGVTTIALVTRHRTSTLDLAALIALGGEDVTFSLVHTVGIPALFVGGFLHNDLLR